MHAASASLLARVLPGGQVCPRRPHSARRAKAAGVSCAASVDRPKTPSPPSPSPSPSEAPEAAARKPHSHHHTEEKHPRPEDYMRAHAADQICTIAASLSGQRCRELLAAINTELLKSALVSSPPSGQAATGAAGAGQGASRGGQQEQAQAEGGDKVEAQGGGTGKQCTCEGLLLAALEAVRRVQGEACDSVSAEQAESWERVMWDVYHTVSSGVGHTLFDLHTVAANLGSAEGALQVAHCLDTGMLVHPDERAAFEWTCRAAELGSPAAALKLGVHYFEGQPPVAADGASAYDWFSRALELCEKKIQEERAAGKGVHAAPAEEGGKGEQGQGMEGQRAPSAGLEVVRRSALTWIGRCHLDGRGLPRNVAEAANYFRAAGNKEELDEIARLKRQFAAVELVELDVE